MPRSICTIPTCECPVVGRGYCTKHYQRVMKHGDPYAKFEYWPEPMRVQLDDMLSCGWSDERISRVLGRSASSVKKARLRFGFKARYRQAHTAREVARIMGVHHMKPQQWMRDGLLFATRTNGARYGRFKVYRIKDSDLFDFIDDPKTWHLWDPANITDDNLRTYAERVRANDASVWLTMKEAVDRTGLQYMKIWHAIDASEISVRRDGNCILIEQSDLAAWYVEQAAVS